MSDPRIRDFAEADYPAYAAVHNSVFADYPESEEHLARNDSLRNPKYLWKRWVWEEESRVLGIGYYGQDSWNYHPRKFYVEVMVTPEARRRGIGAALYEHVVEAVAEHDPEKLFSLVNEKWDESMRFAVSRGFEDGMRLTESRFDFQTFDPKVFEADIEKVREQGIVIRSWAELEGDPELERELYAVAQQLLSDMPSTTPYDPPPFELWRERALESQYFLPELYLIALDGERMIGVSNFWGCEIKDRANTGLTGVLAEYRKRGIATALKIRAISSARAAGYRDTLTWNAEENAGMLGINTRLGFRAAATWIEMERALGGSAREASGA